MTGASIVEPCMVIAFLVVLSWLQHRKCKCDERGTFLKPRWKKYGKGGKQ